MRTIAVLLSLFAFGTAYASEAEKAPLPSNDSKQAPYEIPTSAPSILGFTLLKTTFAQAEQKLGAAKQHVESDETESPVDICYLSDDKNDSTVFILDSDYTGGWDRISGYALEDRPSKIDSPCTRSPLITRKLKVLDGHLSLGMTKQDVIAILGKPHNRDFGNWGDLPKDTNPDRWEYTTTWKIPFSEADKKSMEEEFGSSGAGDNPQWDAWTGVILKFRDSRLVEIDVNHGVSD